MKKLSIIIPAYNVQNYIVRTLSSILTQNNSDIEIIVVDDGSTDQTAQVVTKAIESSSIPNITLYSNCNGGVSSARNFGLDRAIGEYVYFLDGDDYVADDFIGQIFKLVEENKPQIVFWRYDFVSETGEPLSAFPFRTEFTFQKTGLEVLNLLLLENAVSFCVGSIAYRRDFLTENKMHYRVGCVAGEDFEFICKSLSCASSVLFTERIMTHYFQRATSVTHTCNIAKFDAVLAHERVRSHFQACGSPEMIALSNILTEYHIPICYIGIFAQCLEQLTSNRQMATKDAMRKVKEAVEASYPSLHYNILSGIKMRKRKKLPDKLDVFLLSPVLYNFLARMYGKIKRRKNP